jgi:hypothetical protein
VQEPVAPELGRLNAVGSVVVAVGRTGVCIVTLALGAAALTAALWDAPAPAPALDTSGPPHAYDTTRTTMASPTNTRARRRQ